MEQSVTGQGIALRAIVDGAFLLITLSTAVALDLMRQKPLVRCGPAAFEVVRYVYVHVSAVTLPRYVRQRTQQALTTARHSSTRCTT